MERLKLEDLEENLILNPSFDSGLESWSSPCCILSHSSSGGIQGVQAISGQYYAIVSKRTASWQGIEQSITDKIKPGVTYELTVILRISGLTQSKSEDVLATLRLENRNCETQYLFVGSVKASDLAWGKLHGSFLLDKVPENAVFYVEGPPPGIDIIIDNVFLRPASHAPALQPKTAWPIQGNTLGRDERPGNIIRNPVFADGLEGWRAKGCKVSVIEGKGAENVTPWAGRFFAVASNRTASWQGIEQEVTGQIEEGALYNVSAIVRIHGAATSANVLATLWLETFESKELYITLGSVQALHNEWTELTGELLINKAPRKSAVYLEGPPPGVDILVDSVAIFIRTQQKLVAPPVFEDPKFGVNIVKNSNLLQGLTAWYSLGSCRLSISSGGPTVLPPIAQSSLSEPQPLLSMKYMVVTNRTHIWEGPAQTITDELQVFLNYQVTAWVSVRSGQPGTCHKVNVALGVDGKWVTGGEVETDGSSWKEVMGSFRLEKRPESAIVYVQGPAKGVDILVAGLQIFSVDRLARVAQLRLQAEKIRKRNVVLRLCGTDGRPYLPGLPVTIEQRCSFPLGSCINHYSLENRAYIKFFLEHFNWTVFENEIKWGWTEQTEGKINYKEADELINFCIENKIPCRGHCILWETESSVQDWLKTLSAPELSEAVQNRVASLLSRYRGQFRHYDVNNEMLHGSFYRDKLGSEFLSYLFKLAKQFDPEAVLFVNDYHVEDGCDCHSSPEKYINQIQGLISQGAPVGGIGVQGHMDVPNGPILQTALDKLGRLGLPIWLTEVDVSSSNEFVRADDLEVVLREAFAHPAVDGIMLWGFWEGAMCRKDSQLVDSDKRINEAGLRFISLKQEWRTSFTSRTNENGEMLFRGFHGEYDVVVNNLVRSFEVVKGDGHQLINMAIE